MTDLAISTANALSGYSLLILNDDDVRSAVDAIVAADDRLDGISVHDVTNEDILNACLTIVAETHLPEVLDRSVYDAATFAIRAAVRRAQDGGSD